MVLRQSGLSGPASKVFSSSIILVMAGLHSGESGSVSRIFSHAWHSTRVSCMPRLAAGIPSRVWTTR